jgi:hypothetical protein
MICTSSFARYDNERTLLNHSVSLFLCFRYRFLFTCHLIEAWRSQLTSHHARGFDFEVDLTFPPICSFYLYKKLLQRSIDITAPFVTLPRTLASPLSINSLSPFHETSSLLAPCSVQLYRNLPKSRMLHGLPQQAHHVPYLL